MDEVEHSHGDNGGLCGEAVTTAYEARTNIASTSTSFWIHKTSHPILPRCLEYNSNIRRDAGSKTGPSSSPTKYNSIIASPSSTESFSILTTSITAVCILSIQALWRAGRQRARTGPATAVVKLRANVQSTIYLEKLPDPDNSR